ncbi:transposase [Singulisphaera sp. GP187]|uniref:transposase n=1 Tax=Singulisphaera sp. GP187 TaxID=1882752 RepID=UPI0009F8CEB4|nr:transposase [Singulisphaera sp. GP187]
MSEAEVHWREFLVGSQARGLHGVKMVEPGPLRPSLGVPWQWCPFQLMKKALAFLPGPSIRPQLVASLRAVFGTLDRPEAEQQLETAVKKRRKSASKVSERLEANVPEAPTMFTLPPGRRRRSRTSNVLERVYEEIKRRASAAGQFTNDASTLRLVSTGLMEISEDWEASWKSLTMGPDLRLFRPGIYRSGVASS